MNIHTSATPYGQALYVLYTVQNRAMGPGEDPGAEVSEDLRSCPQKEGLGIRHLMPRG